MSGQNGLVWSDELGYGCYPVKETPYDRSYFEKYVGYSRTARGVALTDARVELVRRHVGEEPVVDIGIGSGDFIEKRGTRITSGYDVNPEAIRWLLERGLWCDPYFKDQPNVTCFDSLEHLKRPEHLVARVEKHLFLSIPIFEDRDHVLRSKHFRKDEHFYYFTRDGLIRWMSAQGFALREENRMEVELGREDIGTFVFRRIFSRGWPW
jgi:Methyltransferase domain